MANHLWRSWAAAVALAPVVMLGCPSVARATTPPILLGIHTADESLPMVSAMNSWENKANAFVDTERGWSPNDAVYEAQTLDKLKSIWAMGSIPQLSWYPTGTRPSDDVNIAAGTKDVYITKFLQQLRPLLAGPDGLFGNGDDRRLFLRFAPEANGDWHTYSPIYSHEDQSDPDKNVPPPPDDRTEKQNAAGFVAMWRHVHALFTANGLDSTHVAWIFAVAERDSWWGTGPRIMEQLFPGDAFVDWVGVDGYNRGGLQSNDHWRSPSDVMDPMLTRLRAVSTKPTAVSEYGSTAIQDDGSQSVAAKAQWLNQFAGWIATSGVRMAMYWNDNNDNPDYPIFGGPYGDDHAPYNGGTVPTYDEYRALVSAPAFVGADDTNPRVVSDALFLGS